MYENITDVHPSQHIVPVVLSIALPAQHGAQRRSRPRQTDRQRTPTDRLTNRTIEGPPASRLAISVASMLLHWCDCMQY